MKPDEGRFDPPNDTFERWYREHHFRLLSRCRRIVGDTAAAEDIAQETLLRAWLGRDRMREEEVGAWLTVVARNLCISYLRRQKKQIPTEFVPETSDGSLDPADLVERIESRRAVRNAMRQLGGRHGRVLQLREIEGIGYEELSTELGLTAAGARTVLFRARRMLRERLAAVGEGMAAFLAGVRIRLRAAVIRSRSSVENSSVVATSAAPAALNVIMALGVTFAILGSGSSFAVAAAGSAGPAVYGMVAAPIARSDRVDGSSNARMEGASYRHASDEFITPLLRKPDLKTPPAVRGHAYGCDAGDTSVMVDVGGQHTGIEWWREPDEPVQPVYDLEDQASGAATSQAPVVCDYLGKQINVSPEGER